ASGNALPRRRERRPRAGPGAPASDRARNRECDAAPAGRHGPRAGKEAGRARLVPGAGQRGDAVTAPKSAVRVVIGGEEYAVRSELPRESTREVAASLDAALKRVKDMLPMVESHKAAILAALAITDELFQARRGDREIAARLSHLNDDVASMLPPAQRGSP